MMAMMCLGASSTCAADFSSGGKRGPPRKLCASSLSSIFGAPYMPGPRRHSS
eukprot:CAMPEP_0203830188 /NCGR_PEP_ID=MMETSP0115-20131106/65399_1 /ASSEMBLY_ACC=CAM_ASM_000227 /TAXON_ID=33651 /ORGANISM="Bicosoecid sp, Strain ms1" /LENGTH=51 /DNA_ID=CAMNT_0050739247 /DNA_START=33 /DNA_END=185 /DNA_ORIENTATION=-